MIYAIGDIHGQATMLEAGLNHIRPLLKADDAVVFLGDYIDRGEDSSRVFRVLDTFQKVHWKTFFLQGNHEELFLRAYDNPHEEFLWLINGGADTLVSYGVEDLDGWRDHIPEEDVDFIRNTQMDLEGNHFYFVHAGIVPPGVPDNVEAGRDPRLWIRDPFIDYEENFERIVVFGHTIQHSGLPLVMNNKVGLDTGAVIGGKLSIACFNDDVEPDHPPSFMLYQVDDECNILQYEIV